MKNLVAWLSGGLVSARLKAGLGNLIIDIFSNLNDSMNINVRKNQTTTTKRSGQRVSAPIIFGVVDYNTLLDTWPILPFPTLTQICFHPQ